MSTARKGRRPRVQPSLSRHRKACGKPSSRGGTGELLITQVYRMLPVSRFSPYKFGALAAPWRPVFSPCSIHTLACL